MPVFATPLVLLGLDKSLPALAAIYYLHARRAYSRFPVCCSGPMRRSRPSAVGVLTNCGCAPVFWLELLLMLLLVLAAVGIHIPAE